MRHLFLLLSSVGTGPYKVPVQELEVKERRAYFQENGMYLIVE